MCNPNHNANCALSKFGGEKNRIEAEEYFFRNSDHGKSFKKKQDEKRAYENKIKDQVDNTKGPAVSPNESRERFYDEVRKVVHFDLPEDIHLIEDELKEMAESYHEIEQGISDTNAKKEYLESNRKKIIDSQKDFYPCFRLSPNHINEPFCDKAHERSEALDNDIAELNDLIKEFEDNIKELLYPDKQKTDAELDSESNKGSTDRVVNSNGLIEFVFEKEEEQAEEDTWNYMGRYEKQEVLGDDDYEVIGSVA